jgi:hypothetical protein
VRLPSFGLAGEVLTVALEPSKLSERVRLPSPALSFGVESEGPGEWRSLVAHPAGGRAVAGSNPVSPTIKTPQTRGFYVGG